MIRDGFPGQRLQVLPAPVIEEASRRVPTSLLLPTDVGYFPHAREHGRRRVRGAAGAIVMLCVTGRGWCESPAGRHVVTAGQALVIAPRVPHLYRADDADPWTIWWAHVAGSTVPQWVAALGAEGGVAVHEVPEPRAVVAGLAQLVLQLESDLSRGGLRRASGLAWEVLSALGEPDAAAGEDEPVRQVQHHLRENLAAAHRVDDLAALVGLSRSHLAARFRQATGGGVIDYLTGLRMARARELLALTSLPVSEVAAQVGFGDPFYFSRVFARVHGSSPSAFRERYSGS